MDQTLTFRKYKNKLLSYILKEDRQYLLWLCSQIWYKERYPELYNTSLYLMEENKPTVNDDMFIVYTDGACPHNGSPKARSSIGIHFSEKNPVQLKDISEVLHLENHSNNIAELSAINRALTIIKENNIKVPIRLYTDSKYCQSILLEWYENWTRYNLLHNKKNLQLIKETYELYQTFNDIDILYIHAHTKKKDEHSYGNDIADKLARGAFKNINMNKFS